MTTWLCPHTFVPRHVCAHTRLRLDTSFVPTVTHTFVPRHICAQSWLYPHMTEPRHVYAKALWCHNTNCWPDTIMSMYYDNIIIVSTRLCSTWLLKTQACSNIVCVIIYYCSPITSSIFNGIFRNFIITCQSTKYVSGHKRVWVQTCLGTIVSGHNRVSTIVWGQACMCTNVWSPLKTYITLSCSFT